MSARAGPMPKLIRAKSADNSGSKSDLILPLYDHHIEECERLIDVTETSGVLRHVSLNGYTCHPSVL